MVIRVTLQVVVVVGVVVVVTKKTLRFCQNVSGRCRNDRIRRDKRFDFYRVELKKKPDCHGRAFKNINTTFKFMTIRKIHNRISTRYPKTGTVANTRIRRRRRRQRQNILLHLIPYICIVISVKRTPLNSGQLPITDVFMETGTIPHYLNGKTFGLRTLRITDTCVYFNLKTTIKRQRYDEPLINKTIDKLVFNAVLRHQI